MSIVINDLYYLIPINIIVIPIYILYRFLQYKKNSIRNIPFNKNKEICLLGFLFSIIFIEVLTIGLNFMIIPWEVFAEMNKLSGYDINIIPFTELYGCLQDAIIYRDLHSAINLFGNVILFIPLGFFLALLLKSEKRQTIYTISVSFITSLFIEIIQYFIARGTDINDIMLNTLGGYLGLFILKLMQNKWSIHFLKSENYFANKNIILSDIKKKLVLMISIFQIIILIFSIIYFIPLAKLIMQNIKL